MEHIVHGSKIWLYCKSKLTYFGAYVLKHDVSTNQVLVTYWFYICWLRFRWDNLDVDGDLPPTPSIA